MNGTNQALNVVSAKRGEAFDGGQIDLQTVKAAGGVGMQRQGVTQRGTGNTADDRLFPIQFSEACWFMNTST